MEEAFSSVYEKFVQNSLEFYREFWSDNLCGALEDPFKFTDKTEERFRKLLEDDKFKRLLRVTILEVMDEEKDDSKEIDNSYEEKRSAKAPKPVKRSAKVPKVVAKKTAKKPPKATKTVKKSAKKTK